MSQHLMSERYFQETDDGRTDGRCRVRGYGTLLTKAVLNSVFWIALVGGGGFMAVRATIAANSEKSYAGHGGHPALSIMSFCMNLVSFDWDESVEDRIRRNMGRPEHSYGNLREAGVSTPVAPLELDIDEIGSDGFDGSP